MDTFLQEALLAQLEHGFPSASSDAELSSRAAYGIVLAAYPSASTVPYALRMNNKLTTSVRPYKLLAEALKREMPLAYENVKKIWHVVKDIPAEGGRDEPLYGEINSAGIMKVFNVWKKRNGFNADSVFLDIGCGSGFPVFAATAAIPGLKRSVGVDISEFRLSIATHLLIDLKNRKLLARDADIQFFNQDICSAPDLFKATHIYSYNISYPGYNSYIEGSVIDCIVKSFNASESAQCFACFVVPRLLIDQYHLNATCVNPENPDEPHRFSVGQAGARAGTHSVYLYTKIRP
jgi:SAM-dependent methyltransferase